MSLTEETSSVEEVQKLVKQQLGFEVILLDANLTSSTDEVSSVSDKAHLELFSRRRHVHHMSDFCRVTKPFLVVVKVGRFCMATALCRGGGFYERVQRVSKILFLPRENKIHIFKPPCNVLLLNRQNHIDKIIEGNDRNYVIDKFTCEIMENKLLGSRM